MSQTMLYKCPGPYAIHGGQFDYTIVEDDQIQQAIADGWSLTTPEAKSAYLAAREAEAARIEAEAEAEAAKVLADADKPPTRAELEQMATKLGLKFDGRTGDKKLRGLIDAALAPNADGA